MAKYNRQLLLHELTTPHYRSLGEIADRATGRSTAALLMAVAKALDEPGTEVEVVLHTGEPDNFCNHQHRQRAALDLIAKLGLQGLTVTLQHLVKGRSGCYPGYRVTIRNDFSVVL